VKLHKVVSIQIVVIALLVVQGLPAFQVPDATKVITKKAKKATKDTADGAGRATSSAAGTGKKGTARTKKAGAPETAAARQAASSTTDTSKKTTGRADRMASSATETATPAPAKIASDSEIALAKASGKVWVNTESGAYHKGGRWYGATKQGKFMTEQDAIGAGYHAAGSRTH
jgi:hypothetical protein